MTTIQADAEPRTALPDSPAAWVDDAQGWLDGNP